MGKGQHGTAVRIPAARLFLTPSLIGGKHVLHRFHAPMERCQLDQNLGVGSSGSSTGPMGGDRAREDQNVRRVFGIRVSNRSWLGVRGDGRLAATGSLVVLIDDGGNR